MGELLSVRSLQGGVPASRDDINVHRSILNSDPDNFNSLNAVGIHEVSAGNVAEAIKYFLRATQVFPGGFIGHNNLGNAYRDARKYNRALESYNKALELNPSSVKVAVNKGLVLFKLGRIDEAQPYIEAAVRANPNSSNCHNNLGLCYSAKMKHDLASQCFDRALEITPGHALSLYNKSFILLANGDYINGFKHYEYRWCESNERRAFNRPVWNGHESLKNKTLFVYCEQGYGDAIQMFRFIPELSKIASSVVFETRRELISLFQENARSLGNVSIISRGDRIPGFDYFIPMMSISLALKLELNSVKGRPYLFASQSRASQLVFSLGIKTKPRIGLAWQGNRGHVNDFNRSIQLHEIINDLPDSYDYFVLQKNIKIGDQLILRNHPKVKIVHLGDFDDTAALCSLMDAVISVDTSVAHLAGSMGKPVLMLAAYVSDWRWLKNRADSPWYDSVRIYRQSEGEGWSSVVKKAVVDVSAIINACGNMHESKHQEAA